MDGPRPGRLQRTLSLTRGDTNGSGGGGLLRRLSRRGSRAQNRDLYMGGEAAGPRRVSVNGPFQSTDHGLNLYHPEAQAPGQTPNPFLRQPTDLHQGKQGESSRLAAPVNLEGGLAITLNMEINPRDPSGITNPYKLLVPMLWYQDTSGQRQRHQQQQLQQQQRQVSGGDLLFASPSFQGPQGPGPIPRPGATPGPPPDSSAAPMQMQMPMPASSPERNVLSEESVTPERELSPDSGMTPEPGINSTGQGRGIDPEQGVYPEEGPSKPIKKGGWTRWLSIRRNRDTSDHPEYHPDTSEEDMGFFHRRPQQVHAPPASAPTPPIHSSTNASHQHGYLDTYPEASGAAADVTDDNYAGNISGPSYHNYRNHRGRDSLDDDGDEEIDEGLLPEEMIPHGPATRY